MTTRTVGELRAHITNRAVEDEDFRAQLLTDPRSAISAELGLSIPESFTIHVHEDDAVTAHLTLPPSDKLTEAELAQIAGGPDVGVDNPY